MASAHPSALRWIGVALLALAHAALAVGLVVAAFQERLPGMLLVACVPALLAAGLALRWRWVRWLAALVGAGFVLFGLVFSMAVLWPAAQVQRLQLVCLAGLIVEIAAFIVASRFRAQ